MFAQDTKFDWLQGLSPKVFILCVPLRWTRAIFLVFERLTKACALLLFRVVFLEPCPVRQRPCFSSLTCHVFAQLRDSWFFTSLHRAFVIRSWLRSRIEVIYVPELYLFLYSATRTIEMRVVKDHQNPKRASCNRKS